MNTELKIALSLDDKVFDSALSKVSTKLENFSSKLKNLASSLSALSIPVGIFGAATIKAAADFEEGMNAVAAISNATASELQKMQELAKNLGKTTQFSASEAAAGMEMLARNGLKASQILGGTLDATLKLAAATGTNLSNAANIATDVMAQFGVKAEDMIKVVDKIAGVTVNSKFSIDDYRLAIAQAGGVAANLGVRLDDFNAAIAATAPLFASGSDAGTSFKTFLTSLSPKSKEAADLMKSLGLNFFNANGSMKSMQEIVQILNNSFKNLTEEQKNNAAATIFGSDAMRTALALANMTGKEFDALAQNINKVSATQMAQTRMQGFNGALRALKSAFEALQIAIAQSGILNFLTRTVQKLTEFINKISSLNPQILRSVSAIAALVAALPALLLALSQVIAVLSIVVKNFGLFVAAAGKMINSITKLTPAINSLRATSAAMSAAFAAPLLKIVAIAGALYIASVAARSLYKTFESVREIVAAIVEWFENLLNAIKNFAIKAINYIASFFKQLYDFAKNIPILSKIADGIKSGLESIADIATSDKAKEFGKNFVETLQQDFNTIKDFAKSAFLELGKIFDVGVQQSVVEKVQSNVSQQKALTINIPVEWAIKQEKIDLSNVRQEIDLQQIRENLMKDFERINVSSAAFFSEFDVGAERLNAVRNALQQLIDKGYEGTAMFKNLSESFKEMVMMRELEQLFANIVSMTGEMVGAVIEGTEELSSAIRKIIKAFIAQGIAAVISKTLIAQGYSGPIAVALAGAAGAAASALFNAAVPKFAKGGIVRGETIGLFGEYANALNNPEVVAPLDTLQDMLNSDEQIYAETVIRGEDLVTILRKTNMKLNYKFSV